MKAYFTYYGHSTQAKNKLQRAIMDYFESLSQTLIPEGQLPKFKEQCYLEIKRLNALFNRCKSEKISIEDNGFDKDYIRASGLYNMNFYLYVVKSNFSTSAKKLIGVAPELLPTDLNQNPS